MIKQFDECNGESERWWMVSEPGGTVVRVVGDDDGVVTRAPGEDTTVTNVVLHVADDGSLGDPAERQHVADG